MTRLILIFLIYITIVKTQVQLSELEPLVSIKTGLRQAPVQLSELQPLVPTNFQSGVDGNKKTDLHQAPVQLSELQPLVSTRSQAGVHGNKRSDLHQDPVQLSELEPFVPSRFQSRTVRSTKADLHQLSELESLVPKRFQPRILCSIEADPHQFPHQVLLKVDLGDYEMDCTGSIIRNNVILTSATCLKEATEVTVIAGVHNQDKQENTQQKVLSKKLISHENFNPDSFKNNIALIRLPTALTFNNYVKSISIYKKTTDLAGKEATISGWGVYDSSNKYSGVLRYSTNKITLDSVCRKHFIGYVDGNNFCFSGEGGTSPGIGDIGVPLHIAENNELFVAGVGSFGYKNGANLNLPSAFTKTSSYAKWIDDNINKL